MNAIEKVAQRHADIPQDALPLDIPDAPIGGGDDTKTTAQKSIKWAKCPHHVADPSRELTGLISIDNKTLAFRDHHQARRTPDAPLLRLRAHLGRRHR